MVLAAVDRPGEAAALRRHLEAEIGIGNDIDPGCRRGLAWPEDRDIFAPVGREAAEAVKELQTRRWWREAWFRAGSRPLSRDPLNFLRFRHTVELIGERAALSDQNNARHRHEQAAGFRRKQVGPQHEAREVVVRAGGRERPGHGEEHDPARPERLEARDRLRSVGGHRP